jgi:glycosyltransferase involved in cell wall biosynthesis
MPLMYRDRKVIVVMPAYNAGATLQQTYDEIVAQDYVDEVLIVDDASTDDTDEVARGLSRARVHRHEKNLGYGANQKTCYRLALDSGAGIVVMVHADYQYTPSLIPAMVSLIGNDLYHCVIGSRILGGNALSGGMPLWRYAGNRFLTAIQNLATGAKLSEYHSGYRAYSRRLLERVPLEANSDDFVFDNQMMIEIIWMGYVVAEVSCPTRYAPDASSIDFWRSVRYGIGCLSTTVEFLAARLGLGRSRRFIARDHD